MLQNSWIREVNQMILLQTGQWLSTENVTTL